MPSLVEIDPVILEKKIFKISLKYFHYFAIISPWKMTLYLNKIVSSSINDICASLVEISPVVLKKKSIF